MYELKIYYLLSLISIFCIKLIFKYKKSLIFIINNLEKMSENNRSLGSGMKSVIKHIDDNLNQSGSDEENKNQQSDELPFISELSEIEKDKKITYHYICPKCQTFPYIDIIDKNTIKKRCQCFEKEKEKDEEKETKKDQKIDKEKDEEKES